MGAAPAAPDHAGVRALMGIAITMKDLPRELQRREGAVRAAARRGARIAAQRAKALLMHRTPVDTGELKSSWKVARTKIRGSNEVALIENTAPHAGIVEMGARPHAVSEAGQLAIYEWVKRHFEFRVSTVQGPLLPDQKRSSIVVGGISRDSSFALRQGERRARKLGGPLGQLEMDSELVRIAEAIVNKLRARGQKPTYFVRDSLPDLQRFLREEVEREIRAQAAKRDAREGGG